MLKVYSGILYPYKNYNIGFNINHIKFKDGKINSTQIGFIVDYNYKDVYFTKIPQKLSGTYGIEKVSFSPFILEYFPINSQTTTEIKQKRFTIIGAEISKDYENYFTYISAGGAFKRDSGGYAVGMFGGELKYNNIFIRGSIGAAGGGSINVDGGMITKIETGLKYKKFFVSFGKIKALNGRLNTAIISIGLNFDFYKGFVK